MSNLLLAPDVVLAMAARSDEQQSTGQLLSGQHLSGQPTPALQADAAILADKPWVYAGSAAALHRQATEHWGDASRLDRITEQTQWLSALGSDLTSRDGLDLATSSLAAACNRLGPEAVLLTDDAHLLTAIPQATASAGFAPQQSDAIDFIDLKRQQTLIRDDIEQRLAAVLRHGRYVLGPEMIELEDRLADYTGAAHAITVSSGTDALVIALMALEIGPGDEVITTPYTWISTAEAVSLVGATPVFVDIDETTFNIDPAGIEAAITSRTRAIMPVSLYGQCADLTAINAIAVAHDLPVIEDAAQSFGATHHGGRSCGLTTIGTTSFFPSKPLGGYGDGGACFTSDADLAERMTQIRVHGQKRKHEHPIIGMNGRMDTMQAAVVLSKMAIFDDECRARRTVAARYEKLLAERGLGEIARPQIVPGNESVYAQYTIRCENPDQLNEGLAAAGVPSVSYYIVPVPFQAAYADLGHRPGDFPVCERVATTSLSLPMSPYLDAADQTRIVDAIEQAVVTSRGSQRRAA